MIDVWYWSVIITQDKLAFTHEGVCTTCTILVMKIVENRYSSCYLEYTETRNMLHVDEASRSATVNRQPQNGCEALSVKLGYKFVDPACCSPRRLTSKLPSTLCCSQAQLIKMVRWIPSDWWLSKQPNTHNIVLKDWDPSYFIPGSILRGKWNYFAKLLYWTCIYIYIYIYIYIHIIMISQELVCLCPNSTYLEIVCVSRLA